MFNVAHRVCKCNFSTYFRCWNFKEFRFVVNDRICNYVHAEYLSDLKTTHKINFTGTLQCLAIISMTPVVAADPERRLGRKNKIVGIAYLIEFFQRERKRKYLSGITRY